MSVEGDGEAVTTTVVALRAGDPVVEALEVAGPGALVIARVLPPFLGASPRGSLPERREEIERSARESLAELVGRRRPVPRLEVRFGDAVQQVRELVAEVGAGRVIAARALADRLVGAVPVPVISAEEGELVHHRGPLRGIAGVLRRGLERPADEKLEALRAVEPFCGVGDRELRHLASLFDVVEVGPGHVLTSEGRANDTLWILLNGTAASSIGGRELGRLGPHSLIGAPSMLYGQRAIATMTAVAPVRALVAGRAQFQALEAVDSVALRLKAATADRLRDYLPRSGARLRPA